MDVESPPPLRVLRSAQEKKLRKRKDLDALIVNGTRKKRGSSQELLARSDATSSEGELELGDGFRRRRRNGFSWGIKWGVLIGGFLSVLVLVVWLHLNLKIELDDVRRHVGRVDEASRSAASPIIAIKTLLDDLQNNQTGVYKRLSELETRLTGLETSLVKISSKPQGEDVLQGLADLGGKLTEVQQTVEKLKKENIKNSADVIKLDSTINNLKLHDINKDGEQSPEKSKLPDFETSLSETKNLLNLLQDRFETVNTTLSLVAQNSTARMDWLSKDLSSVQVKISQLEDDNRNVSSRLLNIDGTMNAALAQVKTNLTSLAGVVNSWTPPSPEISPILKKVKLGPRDKK